MIWGIIVKGFMTILEKIDQIKKKFSSLSSIDKYNLLMEMGQKLSPLNDAFKIEENRIKGCQSILYLHPELKDHKLFFYASSDALISKGLAALLIAIYSGETPETILSTPPTFLQEMGILQSLSPTRSNGLAHLYGDPPAGGLHHLVRRGGPPGGRGPEAADDHPQVRPQP
jgi:cysteine desulfuration protein SufE